MKYTCHINARAEDSVPMEIKHQQIITGMKSVEGPLGIDRQLSCPAPEFKHHFTAIFSLTKKMKGISSGFLNYRIRNKLEDHHLSDDRIYFDFLSKKVDFTHVVEVIRRYVITFEAYSMAMSPEDLVQEENKVTFEARRDANRRKGLKYFYPFQFFDKVFVERVFKCEPRELYNKIKDEVKHIEMLKDGIFIQGFGDYATLNECIELNQRIEKVLGIRFPYISQETDWFKYR